MEVWSRTLLLSTVWRGEAETLVSQQNLLGPLWQMLATGEACWPVGEELGLGVR